MLLFLSYEPLTLAKEYLLISKTRTFRKDDNPRALASATTPPPSFLQRQDITEIKGDHLASPPLSDAYTSAGPLFSGPTLAGKLIPKPYLVPRGTSGKVTGQGGTGKQWSGGGACVTQRR